MPHVSRLLDPAIIEQLNHLSLTARRVVEGNAAGLHRSSLKGASLEFRQHRIYAPGDEPRLLDWRVLGRTDRLYVKERDEETNLRSIIALDHSASMSYSRQFGSKMQYAARIAAALAYLMLSHNESVGLASFAETLDRWTPPKSGSRQLAHVIDLLERIDPAGIARPDVACRSIADRLERRGLVIIVSDFFAPLPPLREAVARLRHDRHELILIQIVDPDEMTFPFRDVGRFIGLEGETALIAEPALIKQSYLQRLGRHQDELLQMTRKMRSELFTFVTDRAPVDALSDMMRRHGK